MAKMSLEDLRKLRESTQQQIKKRETEGKQAQIVVGMGTCGIAAGAKDTFGTIVDVLAEKGLVNVLVRQTGCMGLCNNEPTVEVVVRSAARVQGPFQSVPATFDPVQRQLVTPKASPELGFYQLKANGKIELTGVTVDGEHARLNVK